MHWLCTVLCRLCSEKTSILLERSRRQDFCQQMREIFGQWIAFYSNELIFRVNITDGLPNIGSIGFVLEKFSSTDSMFNLFTDWTKTIRNVLDNQNPSRGMKQIVCHRNDRIWGQIENNRGEDEFQEDFEKSFLCEHCPDVHRRDQWDQRWFWNFLDPSSDVDSVRWVKQFVESWKNFDQFNDQENPLRRFCCWRDNLQTD